MLVCGVGYFFLWYAVVGGMLRWFPRGCRVPSSVLLAFLACCIVACVVSVDRFVSMLDICRVCQLLWLVLFSCTHVFGGFMGWRGADHLVGVAYS